MKEIKQPFIIISGKGGSGKSTISLALAHRLAAQGKKIWLVEIGRKRDKAYSRLTTTLRRRQIHHEPTTVNLPQTNLSIDASILDPTQSLSEYVDLKLPTGGLAGVLLNNKITASFLEVVPGLPDLVSLGKLWHMVTKNPKIYDHIILDAPASGHAISLLRSPENFERITKMGPIYKDAKQMRETLSDQSISLLILCTLAEEMALQESSETEVHLKKLFPRPLHIANKVFPKIEDPLPKEEDFFSNALKYSIKRADREHDALEKTKLKIAKELPFLFPDPEADPLYLRLSEHLS
ncbi:MAG: arsenical pump-driving ATPase GET3 [Oligoflexia bacterium]|nr:arsenical pump-driving ATPase GET3 [Oligoflexia bacterium]